MSTTSTYTIAGSTSLMVIAAYFCFAIPAVSATASASSFLPVKKLR